MDIDRWRYVGIVLLVILSAFFSGTETAYSSVNRSRLKRRSEEGGLASRTALYIFDHYERALSAVLIGNNLASIAASSLVTLISLRLALRNPVFWGTVIISVIILVFGEMTPKIAAKQNSERFSVFAAVPLRIFMFISWPVVYIVTWLTERISGLWKSQQSRFVTQEELLTIIETVEDEGLIDSERSDLLQSALEFEEITAREILTPRVDIVAIDIEDSCEEILKTAEASPYSRLPVYQNSIDNVIGILNLKHLYRTVALDGGCDIRAMLIEPCFVHKTMKLPAVLAQMKKRKLHIAIVNDEYGGTLGVLTMEDVLEQLVGDIWDETDEIVESFKMIKENQYEVDADLSIYELFENLDKDSDDFEGDYTTAGGWAIDMLGGFPQKGDSFEYENLTVRVLDMEEHRVTRLSIRVTPQPDREE